ncbi:protein YIPF1-like [Dreissena polymorpha]|uniref:Protein YIPF n=1 Tax=Dreissena polymorpha TaxID=45954 RepID=A0A9D4BIP2_DREPO|nr:protein YIPF1-like [Dreissena polymorpha]KAH3696204.1 hypothetical protein DPMN_083669 [Dreissena polymorpha]
MSSKDDLQFHDSGGQEDVMFDRSGGQLHTFTSFPHSAVDMDDEEEEGGDKSQLLKEGEKKSLSFWTFEYYQQFFDVETREVFHRIAGSMMPIPNRNYLQQKIRPNPDLYGPFWICMTLVFTTAIAGNLANYLSAGGKDYQWRYDFHKVTFAASAIFTYWWIIPAIMYGLLWWRKSQAGFTFLEILCVYGYSLAIYIPISILWVINVAWFKWSLVVVGACLSGGVLVITFWPALKDDTKKIALVIVSLIFVLHLALAAGFVLYFFHVPPPVSPAVTNTTNTAVPLSSTGKPFAVDMPNMKPQESNRPLAEKPQASNLQADKPGTKEKDVEIKLKGNADKPEKDKKLEQTDNNNARGTNVDSRSKMTQTEN